MNPFALPIDWQALTIFLTGIAAVMSAKAVAERQIELRRDEVRLSLLAERREVLSRFRALSGEWWTNARLREEKVRELLLLVRDIELLFDRRTHEAADTIFKDTIFQNMFSRHAGELSGKGMVEERLEAVTNENEKLKRISEKLPELERLLVNATQVGHIPN